MRKKILLTGSTGFVGQQVVRDLSCRDVELYLPVRDANYDFGITLGDNVHLIQHKSIEQYQGGGLPETIDAIVHLVAKAHVTEDESSRKEYEKVNVEGTESLVNIAIEKKVAHFIYLSSIKVNGDETFDVGFTEFDSENPIGVYAETKFQAEQRALLLKSKGVKVSIIRTPLVYGNGVKANMAALVNMVKVLPIIPLGAIDNRRSFISVRNLSDFIQALLFKEPLSEYDAALFLLSDREPVSTAKMCALIAQALNRRITLMSVPQWCIRTLLSVIGKKVMWNKLAGNLEVQGVNAKKYFGWTAPYTMLEELKYLAKENN